MNANRMFPTFLVLVLIYARPALAQTAQDHDIAVKTDVVYREVAGHKLHLDIIAPKAATEPRPTILLVHGIGFTQGRIGLRDHATKLAQAGYACVVVGFRHHCTHPFPAALDDIEAAVDWVRTNAQQHDFDKDRVGLLGFSGGGCLANLVGCRKPHLVKATVSYYAPSDLACYHQNATGIRALLFKPMLEQWLGGNPQNMPKKFSDASPITHAHKAAAPTLLIHGSADEVVPLLQSKRLAEKLNGVGAKVRFLALEGAAHNFDNQNGFYTEVAGLATERFFAEHLKTDRPTAAAKAVPARGKAD